MKLRAVSTLCACLILALSSSAVHALSVEHRADAARLLGTPQNSATVPLWLTSLTNTHTYPVARFASNFDRNVQYKFWKRNSGSTINLTVYILSIGVSSLLDSVWTARGGCRATGEDYDDWTFGSYATSVSISDNGTAADLLLYNSTTIDVTLGGTVAAGNTCILEIEHVGTDANDDWGQSVDLVEVKLVEP